MKSQQNKKNPIHIFNALEQQVCTREEIMDLLSIKESAFYRSINILKRAGFSLNCHKNIYYFENYNHDLKFSQQEIQLLAYLMLLAFIYLPENKNSVLEKTMDKIAYLSCSENQKALAKRQICLKTTSVMEFYREKILAIKCLIEEDKEIRMILNTKEELNLTPIRVCCKNDRVVLECKDNKDNKIKKITLDKIVKIAASNTTEVTPPKDETIFELYGRLAQSYLLKDKERVIDHDKDKIVIANSQENKQELFRRLFRYDILCRVIFPEADVKEFKRMINITLDNIKNFQDNYNCYENK